MLLYEILAKAESAVLVGSSAYQIINKTYFNDPKVDLDVLVTDVLDGCEIVNSIVKEIHDCP